MKSFVRHAVLPLLPVLLTWISAPALAKVDAAQAERLAKDLTPVGAERGGNADNTIPAWTGGIATPPAKYRAGEHHTDPFAGEAKRFTIDASNWKQHKDQLTPGQIAMLEQHKGYQLHVYPTHRTAAYPKMVYAALKKNALNAELQPRGTGVRNTRMTSPFPIPNDGLEIVWNHILRFRGYESSFRQGFAVVNQDGSYSEVTTDFSYLFVYAQPEVDLASIENKIFYLKTEVMAPAKLAGTINLIHESLDQVRSPRQAWRYEAGQRRLRRVPNLSYDSEAPNSMGTRTTDQVDMYNGAPDQYNWELLGKKEIYIPYNAYELTNPKHKTADIIRPGHINQDLARYELHRVWVVEGTLRTGLNHIYQKRRMYFDEDSWQIALTEEYDEKGKLWRVSESHAMNYYEVPVLWYTLENTYDLKSNRYIVYGLDNQHAPKNFKPELDEGDFSTAQVRREAKR